MMRIILLVLLVVFGSSSGASALPVNNPIIAGLVAAYEFTGNADDVSGNGNNGVVNGATLTTDRFGNVGSAYSFDGVDDYINLGSQNFSTSVTVSLWVEFSAIGTTTQTVISKYDGDTGAGDLTIDRSFRINTGTSGPEWTTQDEFVWTVSEDGVANSYRPSQTHAITGNWYHVVSTFDSGDAQIFVNGIGETAWTPGYSSLHTSPVDILLGRETQDHPVVGGLPLHGSIDDVYIYNRALSPTEVQTLYSAVPEPSTALLLGIGLVGMAARRRVS